MTTEKRRLQKREYQAEIKSQCLKILGNKCSCCGFDDIRFLTVDHKNPTIPDFNGKKFGCYQLWLWIVNRAPDLSNYQLLCWNCNCAKRDYDCCPHKQGLLV
jgi:hypothetical protein